MAQRPDLDGASTVPRIRDTEPRQRIEKPRRRAGTAGTVRPGNRHVPRASKRREPVQSIEHTLRALDRLAEGKKDQIERQEKAFADYRAQLNRAFEHEEKLRELLARQAQLNAAPLRRLMAALLS